MIEITDIVGEMSSKAISLKELGISEYAWKFDDFIQVIDILKKNEIVVLGGDVYRLEGDSIISTCDSWYYSPQGETDSEYSCNLALQYVKKLENQKTTHIYSIVI